MTNSVRRRWRKCSSIIIIGVWCRDVMPRLTLIEGVRFVTAIVVDIGGKARRQTKV